MILMKSDYNDILSVCLYLQACVIYFVISFIKLHYLLLTNNFTNALSFFDDNIHDIRTIWQADLDCCCNSASSQLDTLFEGKPLDKLVRTEIAKKVTTSNQLSTKSCELDPLLTLQQKHIYIKLHLRYKTCIVVLMSVCIIINMSESTRLYF